MTKSSVLEAKEHGNYWVFANMIKCMIFKKRIKISAASIKNNYEPIKLLMHEIICVGKIIPIKVNNLVIDAKPIVYAEDAEQYFSFIRPEAYDEPKKWMIYQFYVNVISKIHCNRV